MFADSAMCQDHKCPQRMQCYRYRAIPNDIQSYAPFGVLRERNGECEYFWSINGRADIRPESEIVLF